MGFTCVLLRLLSVISFCWYIHVYVCRLLVIYMCMCVNCWYIHVYVCRLLVYIRVCVAIAGIYLCMCVDCWNIHVYVCWLLVYTRVCVSIAGATSPQMPVIPITKTNVYFQINKTNMKYLWQMILMKLND
jgi:hypothetical protein